MIQKKMIVKEIDSHGRIVIPSGWRKKYLKGIKIIIRAKNNKLEILPHEETDLTVYFDTVKAEIRSDLGDWHRVRKELRRR